LRGCGPERRGAAAPAGRQGIETFPRPIVAALHGYYIGGGTAIAWSGDDRIAADNTIFRAGDAYLGMCRAGAWD